jgi:hypothetical protein
MFLLFLGLALKELLFSLNVINITNSVRIVYRKPHHIQRQHNFYSPALISFRKWRPDSSVVVSACSTIFVFSRLSATLCRGHPLTSVEWYAETCRIVEFAFLRGWISPISGILDFCYEVFGKFRGRHWITSLSMSVRRPGWFPDITKNCPFRSCHYHLPHSLIDFVGENSH